MIIRNIKYSFRMLFKQKFFLWANVVSLSICVCIVMLLLVYIVTEKNVDNWHNNSDRIYRVLHNKECTFSPPFGQYVIDNLDGVESFCRTFSIEATLKTNHNIIKSDNCFFVDSNFFEVFSFPLIQGHKSEILDSKNSVVVSESFATQLFGSQNPIGKSIIYNNRLEFFISGIAKDFDENTHFKQADVIFPFRALNDVWGNDNYLTQFNLRYFMPSLYVLAKPNYCLSGKGKELFDKVKNWYWMFQDGRSTEIEFQPISDVYLSKAIYGFPIEVRVGNGRMLNVLMAIVLAIIAIGLINFMNLFIIQSLQRLKEIRIRKLVGAGKKHIVFNMLTLTFIVSTISVFFSFLLIKNILPVFNPLVGYHLSFHALINNVFAYKLIAMYFVIILFVSGVPLILVIKNGFSSVSNELTKTISIGNWQKGLVVTQYTISIVLIVTMLTINRQNEFLTQFDIGVDKEHVVHIALNSDFKENKWAFKEELQKISGVENVSYCSGFPGVGIMPVLFEHQGEAQNIDLLLIDSNYFDVLKIATQTNLQSNSNNCFINQTASKILGRKGDSFEVNIFGSEIEYQISNVIADINFHPLYEKPKPTFYTLRSENDWVDYALIRLNTKNVQGTISKLKNLYQNFSVNFPFQFAFMSDTINEAYQKELKTSKIITWVTLLAVFISSLGIFILAMFYTQKRVKEIGIRKVNGARLIDVVQMLNREYIMWILYAFTIATPIAYYAMNKWLENFAYKTTLSWWIFVLAGVLALGIALLTVSWQTFRAARQNPVEALRYE